MSTGFFQALKGDGLNIHQLKNQSIENIRTFACSMNHETLKEIVKDSELLKRFLNNGLDQNLQITCKKNKTYNNQNIVRKQSVLYYAVISNNLESVNLLLKRGANANIGCEITGSKKDETLSPLVVAQDKDILESLLKAGADPNLGYKNEDITKTPLVVAVEENDIIKLKLLLKYKANSDQCCQMKTTNRNVSPLFLAIHTKRSLDMIKALLRAGASPFKRYTSDDPEIGTATPFHLALTKGRPSVKGFFFIKYMSPSMQMLQNATLTTFR